MATEYYPASYGYEGYSDEGNLDAELIDELEPEEGDITTHDHREFYQDGKRVLSLPADADHAAALRAYMAKTNFYPNAWFISDHGNAHLIDLG